MAHDSVTLVPVYLRFASEEEAAKVLGEQTFSARDDVGVIHQPTGEVTKGDLGPVPVMAAREGWHVNLLIPEGSLPDELAQFEVKPEAPARRWAGY